MPLSFPYKIGGGWEADLMSMLFQGNTYIIRVAAITSALCSASSTEIFQSRCCCIWSTSKDLLPVERWARGTKGARVGTRDGVCAAWLLCDLLPLPLPLCGGPFSFPLGLVTHRFGTLSFFLFHVETGMQETSSVAQEDILKIPVPNLD